MCANKKEFKLKWREKKHHPSYYLCKNCGLIFAYPQKDENYQQLSVTPVTEKEYSSRIKNFDFRYGKIENYLSNKLPKVLDIGCQNGIFLSYMKNKGCEVLGIEPSKEYANYAKETFDLNVINGIFEKQDIKQYFDLITMFNVLEHTKNPRVILVKISELLEKDGLLVLEIPYIFTPQSLLSFGYWHHFEVDHNWFFNKRNIVKLLIELGFEVISICFIPKVVRLSKILDGLLNNTLYKYIKRNSYLRFRESLFYSLLNSIEIKINIMDYLFIIAKKQS